MADDRIYSGAEAAELLDAVRNPAGCLAEAQVAGLRRLQEAARDLAASVVHHAARADALEAAVDGLRQFDESPLAAVNRLVQRLLDVKEPAPDPMGESVKRYLALEAAAARTRLETEIRRLREELEKPVAGPWEHRTDHRDWVRRPVDDRDFLARVNPNGEWWAATSTDASGGWHGWSATSDACRHDADLVLVAAGFRLVGGVHPDPAEVTHG